MASTNLSNVTRDGRGEVKPLSNIPGDGSDRGGNRVGKLRETELDAEEFEGVDDGLLSPEEPPEPSIPNYPDINIYQQRKTLAQGMMDVALLTANANQLRIALERNTDNYFIANIVLISLSISVQILIGICLIWNSSFNIHKNTHLRKANRVNNITIIGIFIVTILNVFISAFGISFETANPTTNLAIVQ